MSVSPTTLFAIAKLLRPQGRRGEVLAEVLSDLPDLFKAGTGFFVGVTADTAGPVELRASWRPHGKNAGRIVLELAGVDSISSAESLQAQSLFLPESALPQQDPDTFMVRDLVGCSVYNGTELVGAVVEMQFPIAADGHTRLPDAPDLLVVQSAVNTDAAEALLIPFVKVWLDEVDLPNRRIQMHLPPGLLDTAEPQEHESQKG